MRKAFLRCVVGAALVAHGAKGAPADEAALKVREQAILTDYLGLNFDEAEKKLKEALATCGGCTPETRALLHFDLGAVYLAEKRQGEGRDEFVAALKEAPDLAPDKDITTAEIQAVFLSVKGAEGHRAPPAAGGDIVHNAPAAQAAMTPLPLYAELPRGIDATRVYARYKGFGMAEWKTAPLRKMGKGYGGEIPCGDIGESVGELVYFLQATDANGDVVAASARLSAPHKVSIVAQLDGDPPSLPGQSPPVRCGARADCPPNFPGCASTSSESSAVCTSDEDCGTGQRCKEGLCEARPAAPATFKRSWLDIAFQQDFVLLPSASEACSGGSGYTCFDSGGTYYADLPLAGADNTVNGGVTRATSRVLIGYDYAPLANLTVGVRLGYAWSGGPQRPASSAFVPVHTEGRLTYWFGEAPLARSGLRFFALGAGGVAQVDASVPVNVYDTMQAYQAGQSRQFQAWKKSGLGFVALGGGAMYAFTPATGVALEVKGMQMFPTSTTAFGGQLAYLVGF